MYVPDDGIGTSHLIEGVCVCMLYTCIKLLNVRVYGYIKLFGKILMSSAITEYSEMT